MWINLTVGVNHWISVFTHDQLYVAFLHVITLEDIIIFMAGNSDGKTNNVVYLEIFFGPPDRQLFIKNQA